MKNRKGFTLVELLAVIVILANIMIIAIPSVLGTLETARQKTFVEYVTRVMEAGQNQYLTQVSAGTLNTQSGECSAATATTKQCVDSNGVYFYSVKYGLGLSSTGSYEGWVAIVPSSVSSTDTKIFVSLYDTNYVTRTQYSSDTTKFVYYVNYSEDGEPKPETLGNFDATSTATTVMNYVKNGINTSYKKYVAPAGA